MHKLEYSIEPTKSVFHFNIQLVLEISHNKVPRSWHIYVHIYHFTKLQKKENMMESIKNAQIIGGPILSS